MCTYETHRVEVAGSGKGPRGWVGLSAATVYFDHPVHAFAEHTLNIDFAAAELGPQARVALELTAESASRLVQAIAAALASAPTSITGLDSAELHQLETSTRLG